MGRVEGRVALVTGAGRGLGEAAAYRLADEGARVVVTDVNEEGVRETAGAIRDRDGEALPLEHDVTEPARWEEVVEETLETFGGLDVLVNNAGVATNRSLPEIDLQDFREVMEVNATGTFLGMQQCAPMMADRRGGSIVNLSSVAGIAGVRDHTSYGASKGAIRTMTKDVAIEYAEENVRANSIHPAYIDTPMARGIEEGSSLSLEELSERVIPMGHAGEPDDVAWLVVYLASEESRFITGAEIPVDGGFLAQ